MAVMYDLAMEQALLLNASYAPICALSVRRAIVLVLTGKAEVVEERPDRVMRSENFEMPIPSVIRLIRYVNIPHFRKAYLSRRTILRRDDHTCCYCGGKANTMDHVMPRSRGGHHSWKNIVACCFDCNQRKDSHTVEELGWSMRYVPYEPHGDRRIALTMDRVEPEWERWMASAK